MRQNENNSTKPDQTALNLFSPIAYSLSLSLSLQCAVTKQNIWRPQLKLLSLSLSLAHIPISDSKQRQLVICQNMLADLLCLPDNQRSFTVFIFSLLFWKLNELTY